MRNSTAYSDDLRIDSTAYDVNVPRVKTVCSASTPEVRWGAIAGYHVQGIDGTTILCTKNNSTKLEKTTTTTFDKIDGYQTVVDIERTLPKSQVFAATVLSNGRWLMCAGPTSDGAYLFYSDDKGVTWTQCGIFGGAYQNRLDSGYVAGNWAFEAQAGPEIVIGEYGDRNKADGNLNPRRVYYSPDYGTNWYMIYEPPPLMGQHLHKVCFAPNRTDVIYVSYGDSPNAVLKKLTYTGGDKTDKTNWSVSIARVNIQPTAIMSDGGYLYLGRDGTGDRGPLILRLDPNDDSCTSVFSPPAAFNYTYSPFGMGRSLGNIFRIAKYNGVFYAVVEAIKAEVMGSPVPPDMYRHGGIYVSVNGWDWVCVYRLIYDGTISQPPSVVDISGCSDGYLWGHAINTDGNIYIVRISPVQAKSVTGVMVESAATNVLTADQSDIFSGVNGGSTTWKMDGTDTGTLSQDITVGLTGSSCLKFTGKSGTSPYAKFISPSQQSNKINTGQRTCASMWVKTTSDWPNGLLCSLYFREGNITEAASYFKPTTEWQKVMVWGTALSNNRAPDLNILIERHNVPADQWQSAIDGKVMYIDAVQITNFTHNANQSWQQGGTPRANEYCTTSVNGITGNFTLAFEWHPQNSSYEIQTTDSDLGILSLNDGSNHVDIYYDSSEGTIVATDGTNSVVTTTITWLHNDSLKFILRIDGGITLDYITPVLPASKAKASSSWARFGNLRQIKLGTNDAVSLFSSSIITNIQIWNRVVTDSEIKSIFGLPSASQGGN